MTDVGAANRPRPPLPWRNAALLSCASAIFIWQLRHPIVRFASPVVNDLVGFVMGLGLPWAAAIAIVRIGRWWSTALAIVSALPLLYYSLVFLLGFALTGLSYKNGRDLGFDRFLETRWKESAVCFYRTNGGATTDFGVVIRQEKTFFPGIRLVRRIDDYYPCYSLDATATQAGIVITNPRGICPGFQEERHQYRLKRFVYF